MPYRFEDGKGSRDRAAVFGNRLRTLSTEVSLMNHISAEVNEHTEIIIPVIGTFDLRTAVSANGSGVSLLFLRNDDSTNFINVDRVFTGVVATSATLPDPNTYISILFGSTVAVGTGTTLKVDNTNQSIINVQPIATMLTGATTSGGVESLRRYLTLNRVYRQELIPQKSDGIILGTGNSMEVFLFTTSSTTIEVSFRFAMVDPDDLDL